MPRVTVGQENNANIEIYYLLEAGYRVIEHLDLRDTVLVGHSMGTGEVTRYLSRFLPRGASRNTGWPPPMSSHRGPDPSPRRFGRSTTDPRNHHQRSRNV